MDARQLQERLEGAFPEASIRVDGGAGRFEVGLVSSVFEGLNRVKRQQLVYKGLGDSPGMRLTIVVPACHPSSHP